MSQRNGATCKHHVLLQIGNNCTGDALMQVQVYGREAVSKNTAHTIVSDDLGKRKICSRFVPPKLTDEQKAKRIETSGDFISMCDLDPLFLENIVRVDETWCYNFDLESKRKSMAWCSPTSSRPKRVVCKNLRSKHCQSPSSTTKASSKRNLFV